MGNAINAGDFDSLSTKLDGLDLTEAEQAILDGILERAAAADDDVSGFKMQIFVKTFKAEVDGRFRPARLADSFGVLQMEAEFTEEE